PQCSSASRFTAGAAGFFVLIQSRECPERDDNGDDGRTVYAPNNGAECEFTGWAIHLGDTGYGAPGEGNCEFDKIEQIGPMAYRIHPNCELRWSFDGKCGIDYRTENFELEIVDGYLEPISKSPEEDNEAGKLNKAQEILGMVLPADEDSALPLDP